MGKLSMCDNDDPTSSNVKKTLNVNAPLFTPHGVSGNGGNILDQILPQQNVSSVIPSGEVMMSSGKYTGPTQPHGKSYFKDEVYIRNADSGKVLPGSMDRLVQITGSVPTNVAQAKVLMEDTIRRNQSPLPDGDRGEYPVKITSGSRPTSMTSVSGGNGTGNGQGTTTSGLIIPPAPNTGSEYRFSVRVGDDLLKISSTNLQLVKSAKILLDEHYTCNVKTTMTAFRQPLFPAESSQEAKKDVNRKICYDRQFLLKCAQAPSSGKYPPNWEQVVSENPEVIRKVRDNNNSEFSENLMSWNANLGQWVSESTRS